MIKVLEDQSSATRTHVERMSVVAVLVDQHWEHRWEDPQGSLASQPGLLGEFSASERSCPQSWVDSS